MQTVAASHAMTQTSKPIQTITFHASANLPSYDCRIYQSSHTCSLSLWQARLTHTAARTLTSITMRIGAKVVSRLDGRHRPYAYRSRWVC